MVDPTVDSKAVLSVVRSVDEKAVPRAVCLADPTVDSKVL